MIDPSYTEYYNNNKNPVSFCSLYENFKNNFGNYFNTLHLDF